MEKQNQRIKHYILAVLGIATGVIADQLTKYLAVVHLKDQEPFVLIENVFQLEYLENRGAAFGLFQNQQIFFMLSVIFITGIVITFSLRMPIGNKYLPLRICSVLILAGAYGNCIDRVRLGYVVDFFYFKLIDFPIFNVADIYVTVSVAIFLVLMFFYYKEEDLDRVFHS
ncbi:MAG: signal peptidase II [Dorea sp.]